MIISLNLVNQAISSLMLALVLRLVKRLQNRWSSSDPMGLLMVSKSVMFLVGTVLAFKFQKNLLIKIQENNLAFLQLMYKRWPFLKSLLSNVDMVLSKSNMNIALEYAQLCEDQMFRIFSTILLGGKTN